MDISTILGFIFCYLCIIGAIFMMEGSSLLSYYDFPGLLITFGGVLAVLLIGFPLRKVFLAIRVGFKAFSQESLDFFERINLLMDFSEKARREGILSLEPMIPDIEDGFLRMGLKLVVDGVEPELIKDILYAEITFQEERHAKGTSMFTYMAVMAPAIGMMGTILGLINVLKNLSDPATIGPSMSVALCTTLYGIFLAYTILNPLASKLKAKSVEEVLFKKMSIEGIMSIQSGESPRILEQKVMVFLPPELRKMRYDI